MLLLYIKKTEGHAKRKIQCPVEHAPPRQIKEKKCLALWAKACTTALPCCTT